MNTINIQKDNGQVGLLLKLAWYNTVFFVLTLIKMYMHSDMIFCLFTRIVNYAFVSIRQGYIC